MTPGGGPVGAGTSVVACGGVVVVGGVNVLASSNAPVSRGASAAGCPGTARSSAKTLPRLTITCCCGGPGWLMVTDTAGAVADSSLVEVVTCGASALTAIPAALR